MYLEQKSHKLKREYRIALAIIRAKQHSITQANLHLVYKTAKARIKLLKLIHQDGYLEFNKTTGLLQYNQSKDQEVLELLNEK